MNTTITTGSAIIGATGLTLAAQDAIADLFSWLHLSTSHPNSWAVLLVAAAGAVMHYRKGSTP